MRGQALGLWGGGLLAGLDAFRFQGSGVQGGSDTIRVEGPGSRLQGPRVHGSSHLPQTLTPRPRVSESLVPGRGWLVPEQEWLVPERGPPGGAMPAAAARPPVGYYSLKMQVAPGPRGVESLGPLNLQAPGPRLEAPVPLPVVAPV